MGRRYHHLLLPIACLTALFVPEIWARCDRSPEGSTSPKSPADGRFKLEISGDPNTYVPGEQYTVFLRSSSSLHMQYKFKEFHILAEQEAPDVPNESGGGALRILGDSLTKFSSRCPNAVSHTNTLPKTEVQVLWVAPKAGSGCVAIKAAVAEEKDIWYADDGPLTRILCEDVQESDDVQPPTLRHCCACDEAKYEVTFEGLWSRNTHPKNFPDNKWSTRFSDVIGASHTVDYSFWNYGEIASEGLRQVAENGNTRMLESELKAKSAHIRTIIKARGISYPNVTGKTFAVFRVDNSHHLMSLVSMIDPSPDWIVGVSGLELCLRNCSWVESKILNLYPWDAGTDDGPTYTSPDQPSTPRQPIRKIKINSPNDPRSPFYDPSAQMELKPFAKLYLSRQRLYEKSCAPSPVEPGEEGNNEGCEVTAWSDWSPCSATCGKGTKYRQRAYINDESMTLYCKRRLTSRASCWAHERHCHSQEDRHQSDPNCAVTGWSEWSSCSATTPCEKGTMTRNRRYQNRWSAKRCAAGVENPPSLEQNLDCLAPDSEDCEESPLPEANPNCPERPWSEWSPCSASCGIGIKIRRRLSFNQEEDPVVSEARDYRARYYDYKEPEEEETEDDDTDDPCANQKMEEKVECTAEIPVCDDGDANRNQTIVCSMLKEVGPCNGKIDRWFFDTIRGHCGHFKYSGCQGNGNNFVSLEQCRVVCGPYQKELHANRMMRKKQLGVTVAGSLTYNMHLQDDNAAARNNCDHLWNLESESQTADGNIIQVPTGVVIDCEVTKWSEWSRCNITGPCGVGTKYKSRGIQTHPVNGGKPCPKKVFKTKTCKIRCKSTLNENDPNDDLSPTWGPAHTLNGSHQDCIMGDWSQWSVCSQSCGPHAIQQRTRSIIRPARGNGYPCLHRLESRSCALLSCP